MVAPNWKLCPHCGKHVDHTPKGVSILCFFGEHYTCNVVRLTFNLKKVKKFKQFVPPGSKPPKDTGTLRHHFPRGRRDS